MRKILSSVLLALLGSVMSDVALAGPADYVYTPNVEYGEREVDFKFGTEAPPKDLPGDPRNYGGSIGVGYGVTEYWFSEVYLKRELEGGAGVTLAEWENKFQLLETGKYPIDLGLITELEVPTSGDAPNEIKVGPLMQSEFGKLQLNLNLLFERAFGKDKDDGTAYTTEFQYQWQVKYRMQEAFEYGLQGMGEMGTWDNWAPDSEQIHKVGPAIFGKIPLGGREAIKYNAAWLKGASTAAPTDTFRMQVEYEF